MKNEILWLPGWYPSRLDGFTGDFIRRHALAVSAFAPVHVLYIVRDKKRIITGSIEIEKRQSGNLAETIIYYASGNFPFQWLEKLISLNRYRRIYRQQLDRYIKENGLPQAVHVHVPFRAGLIALWLKKKFGLNYLVTEHWAGYDQMNPDNFFTRPASFRFLLRKIFRHSSLVIPVSEDLGKKLKEVVPSIRTRVIPNTVNEEIFRPGKNISSVFRWVHYASAHPGQKNTEGLLNVFSKLQDENKNWECLVYGPVSSTLRDEVTRLSLENRVRFTGEITYEEVAELVRSSSAFISFSNYENQPCSILEALCCGLPVVATRVGGMEEIISDQNGLLVKPGDKEALSSAIKTLMENQNNYNREAIARDAVSKFGYHSVGKQLYALYQSL